MAEREEFLQRELSEFVSGHKDSVSLSGVDEIVLSYMVSILDELGSGDASDVDLFDVEEFTEMMDAYLPGFGGLDSVKVSEWMFQLANKLHNLDKQGTSGSVPIPQTIQPKSHSPRTPLQTNGAPPSPTDLSNPFKDLLARPLSLPNGEARSADEVATPYTRTQSLDSGSQGQGQRSRTASSSSAHSEDRLRTLSCSSTASNDTASLGMTGDLEPEDIDDPSVLLLLEMFPSACVTEINYCLSVCHCDTEEAAQLILTREECGQSITADTRRKGKRSGSKKNSTMSFLDDHKMKASIINKYSYVDVDDEKKEHRPTAPVKSQEKKMIRYLDSKIVSTRGERFTEIKKDDDEKMKKTYVNLKPAKQYRFH